LSYPQPVLGSSQRKVLQALKDAGENQYVSIDAERALEKLWKKGWVRWQSGEKTNSRVWSITKAGLEALERT